MVRCSVFLLGDANVSNYLLQEKLMKLYFSNKTGIKVGTKSRSFNPAGGILYPTQTTDYLEIRRAIRFSTKNRV